MSISLREFKEIKHLFESLENQDAKVEMNLETLRATMKREHGVAEDGTDAAVEFLRNNNIINVAWERDQAWLSPGAQWGVWK